MLLDDALSIHEEAGLVLHEIFHFDGIFGIRGRDLGELLFAAMLGVFFIICFGIGIRYGNPKFKKVSIDIAVLTGMLLFFGLGVDALHAILVSNLGKFNFITGIIEDGGEMISLSLLAWYTYFFLENYSEIDANSFYIYQLKK